MSLLYSLLGFVVLGWGFSLLLLENQPETLTWTQWLAYVIVGHLLLVRAENLVRGLRRLLGLVVLGLSLYVIPPAYQELTVGNGVRVAGLIGVWGVLHLLLCRLEAYVTGRYVRIFPWLPGLH